MALFFSEVNWTVVAFSGYYFVFYRNLYFMKNDFFHSIQSGNL